MTSSCCLIILQSNTRTLGLLLSFSKYCRNTIRLNEGNEYIKVDNRFSSGISGEIYLLQCQTRNRVNEIEALTRLERFSAMAIEIKHRIRIEVDLS